MEKNVTSSHTRSDFLIAFTLLILMTSLNLFAQTSENQLTVKTKIVEEKEQETKALSLLKEQPAEIGTTEVESPTEAEAGENAETTEAAISDNSATLLGIAEEHLPPPGNCRVWYLDRPAEDQPKAQQNCERIQKRMPKGAILLYRPLVNSQFVEVCHFDESNRGIVKMVRFYLAATGELQREEKF